MPLPSKQHELYNRVTADLRENYFPGALLPSEPKYAQILGCGRSTLRKTLDVLQEEKKIRRTHSGTYVLDEATGSCPKFDSAERPVYLLLPCANYIDVIDKYSLFIMRKFFSGAMRGAIECGRQLVTLPISETNQDNHVECTDIAWSQASILRKGDDVLFLGRWFRRLLPFLFQTGCRIGYVSQLPEPFPWREELKALCSGYLGYSNTAFMEPAVRILRERNIKHVGCLWFSLEEEERKKVESRFLEILRKNGLSGKIKAINFHVSSEEKGQILEKFCDGNSFDSLIVCPHLRNVPWPERVSECLKHVLLITDQHGILRRTSDCSETILGTDDLFEVARMLTKRLLKNEMPDATELYPYEFVLQNRMNRKEGKIFET